jgi:hypothetical protein
MACVHCADARDCAVCWSLYSVLSFGRYVRARRQRDWLGRAFYVRTWYLCAVIWPGSEHSVKQKSRAPTAETTPEDTICRTNHKTHIFRFHAVMVGIVIVWVVWHRGYQSFGVQPVWGSSLMLRRPQFLGVWFRWALVDCVPFNCLVKCGRPLHSAVSLHEVLGSGSDGTL